MSLRNRLVLPSVLTCLAVLLGCGSSPNMAVAPPSGTFSNSDLSGTYVFSSIGADNFGIFLTAVGTLQANGSGGITGGMIDVNGLDLASPVSTPITSGSYSVSVDGRGKTTLNTSAGSITLDFVLTSGSHGLVTEFDGNGTGSGTIDLQTPGSLQGSYGFGFSGASASGNNEIPFAMTGAFTVDGTGTITSGIVDINSNSLSIGGTSGLALTGTVTAGSPGTAILTTSAGTFSFDVYMVDPAHLKFIEMDLLPVVAGDAFTQQSSIAAGTLAYTMEGIDTSLFPLGLAGFMTSDGASQISAGLEDYNDAGTVSAVTGFTGSYAPFSGGRTVLTLNSIYNGTGVLSPTVTFAAYPTNGGLELLEIDSSGFTGGVAFPQTGTSFASSEGYGLNLTAINAGGFEEDDIAEFAVTGSTFKGLEDINDQGALSRSLSFSGSFTTDSSIAGHGSATSNRFNFNYYVVNSSNTLILETDNNQVGVGSFELQTPPQAPMARATVAAAHARFVVVHPKAGARIVRKQRSN